MKNFFRDIFRLSKTNTIEKQVPDIQTIVVPEPERTESAIPVIDDSYDKFNKIVIKDGISLDNTVLRYRLNSEQSTLIFQIKCVGHQYKFDDKYLAHSRHITWIKSDYKYHFITRIFVTKSNNYFEQNILSNGSVRYKILSRQEVQTLLYKCESNNDKERWHDSESFRSHYVVLPGSYKIDCNDMNATLSYYSNKEIRNNEAIESFEIMNKEEYDKIIEVL